MVFRKKRHGYRHASSAGGRQTSETLAGRTGGRGHMLRTGRGRAGMTTEVVVVAEPSGRQERNGRARGHWGTGGTGAITPKEVKLAPPHDILTSTEREKRSPLATSGKPTKDITENTPTSLNGSVSGTSAGKKRSRINTRSKGTSDL